MNVFRLAWHFFSSMARLKWWKFRKWKIIADPARQGVRFLYCQHCEHYQDGVCEVCGCLVHAKITLNSEKCPKDYWPSVVEPVFRTIDKT